MKFANAAAALAAYVSADIPVFLWGQPGIGKSDMVAQLAESMSVPLVDVRAVLLDPVDLRGLPAVVDGRAVWTPPAFLPDAARDGERGILFLDELNAAPPSVQAACFQLVLNRAVGEYRLPAGWRIIAAGNRAADRAAAQRMPSALANRFAHIDVEPDADAWHSWAAARSLSPVVRAFLRLRPEHFAPADFAKSPDVRAFPTPRSWAAVCRIADAPASIRSHLVGGLVGDAVATEFEGFTRIYAAMPDPRIMIQDPDGAPIPSDPATLYAVCTALAYMADRATFGAVVRYASRIPPEYAAVAIVDATARKPDLKESASYAQWAARNSHFAL